ncbi:permease, partial [Chloroflexota bacterium]
MKETLRFVCLIMPWLLVGVVVAGVITVLVPESVVITYVGGDSLFASFVASFLGALMYFATLTEVPIIKAFTDLGMGKGPALALLLAGPALSLPNMLVIRSIMGSKKTFTYVALVVVMATISGYVFGLIA